MSKAIRIVLVDTSHPGNIGAAARALKNMGLSQLVLVRPKEFPHEEATVRAAGARDVLGDARVTQTVAEAIADCGLVLGCSARLRSGHWRSVEPRAAAAEALAACGERPVAILFGSERSGLSNEDLACCHALINIPTNAEYESLNLAQAVQVLCYEILLAAREERDAVEECHPASADELRHLHDHLERVMRATGFMHARNTGLLRPQVERLLARAIPDSREVQILRGMLTAIESQRDDS